MCEFWVCWVKKREQSTTSRRELTQALHTKFALHLATNIFLERFQQILLVRNEESSIYMQRLHRGYQNKILEDHKRAEFCVKFLIRCENLESDICLSKMAHHKVDEKGFMERLEKKMLANMLTI